MHLACFDDSPQIWIYWRRVCWEAHLSSFVCRAVHVLSGVERSCPLDSGPARVAQTGRVAAGCEWQTKRRGESSDFPGLSAATDLPGSAQRRGLAKSVWQAVTWSTCTSAGPGTGRVPFPGGHSIGKKKCRTLRHRTVKKRVYGGAGRGGALRVG